MVAVSPGQITTLRVDSQRVWFGSLNKELRRCPRPDPGTRDCVTGDAADVVKFRMVRQAWCGHTCPTGGEPQPRSERRWGAKRQSVERWALQVGKQPRAKDARGLQKLGKARKRLLPWSLHKDSQPCRWPRETDFRRLTSRTVREKNSACHRPPSLGLFATAATEISCHWLPGCLW